MPSSVSDPEGGAGCACLAATAEVLGGEGGGETCGCTATVLHTSFANTVPAIRLVVHGVLAPETVLGLVFNILTCLDACFNLAIPNTRTANEMPAFGSDVTCNFHTPGSLAKKWCCTLAIFEGTGLFQARSAKVVLALVVPGQDTEVDGLLAARGLAKCGSNCLRVRQGQLAFLCGSVLRHDVTGVLGSGWNERR